jgi:hydrogenase maturation protein HypF
MQTDNAVKKAQNLLRSGKILAIKGLGGFHLAVDAKNEKAVLELRRRKRREEKPLAIMVPTIPSVKKFCHLDNKEKATLGAPVNPILLLKKRNGKLKLAQSIAPENDFFGIMLPYTPLHHLLIKEGFEALVMTSANISEEPICIDNIEALDRLKNIADYYLVHDRDIYLRCDDSVSIHLASELRSIRRSRGIAPRPIHVQSAGPPVLGVGGELKNTICLLKNDQAFLSQHIGDLENLEAFEFFKLTVEHFTEIFETNPELIVYDKHPEYLSRKWARGQKSVEKLEVQHHHAHLASVMAEHNLKDPLIGLIMDGTGYGDDGTIWGGEVLIGDLSSYSRFAHFEALPLPGGDSAIKNPWRTALSYLYSTYGTDIPDLPFLKDHAVKSIIKMVERGINSPLTSSCGRLFDAVAALSGGPQTIRYEAQAAIELMQKFQDFNVRTLNFILEQKNHSLEIQVRPMIRSIVRAIQNGESINRISSRFHKTLLEIFEAVTSEARKETGINGVVLSGGVFQNQILFETLIHRLVNSGFQVYTHSSVPTNDGGIALGQAMIGRQYINNKKKC